MFNLKKHQSGIAYVLRCAIGSLAEPACRLKCKASFFSGVCPEMCAPHIRVRMSIVAGLYLNRDEFNRFTIAR